MSIPPLIPGESTLAFETVTKRLNVSGVTTIGAITASGLTVAGGSIAMTTTGTGLKVKEGLNAKQGVVTLSSSFAVVSTSAVGTNSRIFMTAQSSGAPGTAGALFIVAKDAGNSFTIGSTGANDSSVVAYEIIDPA